MRSVEQFFYRYGRFVATNPWPFIIIPAFLSLISTHGVLQLHSEDDTWDLYSPLNGYTRVEENSLKRFEYPSASHHYHIQLFINRKDEGDMLETMPLSELIQYQLIIARNITVVAKDFTYPIARVLGQKAFLGYSLADLTFDNSYPPHVLEAKLFILHFMIDLTLPHGKELAYDFEEKLLLLSEEFTNKSQLLQYQILSRQRELSEQWNITLSSIPNFAMTAILLSLFMVLTLINVPLYKSQHLEAIVGIISPCMALWTSVGILWEIGYAFNNVITLVPFLVLCIGVDDAFLLLAGWRQSTKGATLEERMGESVAIAGASVTATDVLCFATGLFSNLRAVQIFCAHSALTLAIDYVYQMTFFLSAMSMLSSKQIKEEEKTVKPTAECDYGWRMKIMQPMAKFAEKFKEISVNGNVLKGFVNILHMKITKFMLALLFVVHIVASGVLITKVNSDFDIEKMYRDESPLRNISRSIQNHMLKESFTVNFAVYPMPVFSNSSIRERFEEMLNRLEHIDRHSIDPKVATDVWTRDYTLEIEISNLTDAWDSTDLLKNYRQLNLDDKFIITKMNENNTEIMVGFYFDITYNNFSSFVDVDRFMTQRRSILADYKDDFTVFSHNPYEKIPTESTTSAPKSFIQTALSGVILMSILVIIFIPKIVAIITVVISIISICVGTVSYLHLWGVHLDTIALITTLISIGFSVDYSAHVCYHYFAVKDEDLDEDQTIRFSGDYNERRSKTRVFHTLKGVAWPVLQAALSTLIGIVPLIFVRAYAVAVFWKTIILVDILGMTHALLLLPVLFIIIEDFKGYFGTRQIMTGTEVGFKNIAKHFSQHE